MPTNEHNVCVFESRPISAGAPRDRLYLNFRRPRFGGGFLAAPGGAAGRGELQRRARRYFNLLNFQRPAMALDSLQRRAALPGAARCSAAPILFSSLCPTQMRRDPVPHRCASRKPARVSPRAGGFFSSFPGLYAPVNARGCFLSAVRDQTKRARRKYYDEPGRKHPKP